MVLLALPIGARLFYETALQKLHDLRHYAEAAAQGATLFKREVAAAISLLVGLTTSR